MVYRRYYFHYHSELLTGIYKFLIETRSTAGKFTQSDDVDGVADEDVLIAVPVEDLPVAITITPIMIARAIKPRQPISHTFVFFFGVSGCCWYCGGD